MQPRWINRMLVAAVLLGSLGARPVAAACVGDCNLDRQVTVNEIVLGIGIALGSAPVEGCRNFDSNNDNQVTVDEIVTSVTNALNGCPDECATCSDGDPCTNDSCLDGACMRTPVTCSDDGQECTAELCESSSGCVSRPVADGTSCSGGAGACESGACVALECVSNGDCDDGSVCTLNACIDNSCVSQEVPCDDDGNECTAELCDPVAGCQSRNVQDGTACDQGDGICRSGTCASAGTTQYRQDFESLDAAKATALSADGWVVYGNVFDSTGKYLYGYGQFPAPNGGPAFSAIDADQGGAEQGRQQLSVYNDYNNMDHSKGHSIEANVYRERRLGAADVGQTITFSFDAKRGNINNPADPLCPCSSKALAFIKTLNPAAGFAVTNFVQVDTSMIPDTWGRYTISLPVDAGLTNQLLQIGFTTTATRFQPSGVFYDNLRIVSGPTVP